jgi:hypothetical protein
MLLYVGTHLFLHPKGEQKLRTFNNISVGTSEGLKIFRTYTKAGA